MQTNFIPKGYRLTVHSWENDSDAWQTKTFEGLTKEGLEFAIAFISLFKNESCNPDCFGNVYEYEDFEESQQEALVAAVEKVLESHPIGRPNLDDMDSDDLEIKIDCIMSLLDTFTGYGEFYIRVVDHFTVDYFQNDVEYITLDQEEIKDHGK